MANDATNAAIINAAGSISSSVVGNATSRKSQKRAEEANLRFWRMQNSYNSPTAQMARLKEAGLNPRYIYGTSGNQAVGNAGDISPAKASPTSFDNPLRNITNFSEVKRNVAATNNLATQNTVNQQRAALDAAKTAGEGIRNSKDALALKAANELYKTSVESAKMALRKQEADTVGAQLDARFKDQTMKNRVMETFYRANFAKSQLSGQEKLNELRQLELNLNRLGIQKGDPIWFRMFGQGTEVRNRYDETVKPLNDWYQKTRKSFKNK